MKLDPKKTAVLTLDFQQGIIDMCGEVDAVLVTASKAAEFARSNGYALIHVGLEFAAGYPEFPVSSPMLKRLKEHDLFVAGSPSAHFHDSIVKPGELIVAKQRVGAFSENQLHMILRAKGIENLVFFGISTSGIVLSTLRRAFDLDFHSVVLSDACFDRDEEVHRVLTEKVFLMQARVLTFEAFVAEQA